MKTPEEIESEYPDLLINLQCNCHKEYFTKYTGDIIADFSQFTDDQSGKKSDDKTDSASKDSPDTPATDGRYYHTIRDVTFSTYKSIFPNRPAQYFYTMTDEERMTCIMHYVNAGKMTTSPLVNILISYIIWGGSLSVILHTYHWWYKDTTLQADALLSEHDTFIKLLDIRRWVYNNCLGEASKINGMGWDRSIINFWKLFKQYYKD